MRDFFGLEGSFNKYGGFVADTFILSLLWFFFSGITLTLGIGASTTALFYVATRRISNREGYIASDFWQAFKANFARSTKVWIVISLLIALIIFSMITGLELGDELPLNKIIFPVQIVTLTEVLFVTVYLFPVLARFDMSVKEAVKSSFFMANRHMITSFTCLGTLAGLVYIIFSNLQIFPLIFAVPGIYAMVSSYFIMKVFKKYRPEMDKDPMLELQEFEKKRADEKRLAEIGKTNIINENEEEESE